MARNNEIHFEEGKFLVSSVSQYRLYLLNHITLEGRALLKIICEPCFIDYQSTVIGILRNKGSGEDGFRSEGKFLVSSVS